VSARRCRSISNSRRWTTSARLPLPGRCRQLANLLRYMDGKVAAEDQIKKLLADPQLMAALKERAAQKGDGGEAEAEAEDKA
jgi:hypothetical protein